MPIRYIKTAPTTYVIQFQDKEVIGFDNTDIARELEEVKQNMPRIISVKQGIEEPKRCEQCRYCRETKKLRNVVHYSELIG
jgi:hypothetical protein